MKVRAVVACVALAGVPVLAACEPSPPPPTEPPPARVVTHFVPLAGSPIAYSDDGATFDISIQGPNLDDPNSCSPVILDNTLTYAEVPDEEGYTMWVVTGGELLVEIDNRAECYRRDPDGDGLEQAVYNVVIDDEVHFAAFDPISFMTLDVRTFAIVK